MIMITMVVVVMVLGMSTPLAILHGLREKGSRCSTHDNKEERITMGGGVFRKRILILLKGE